MAILQSRDRGQRVAVSPTMTHRPTVKELGMLFLGLIIGVFLSIDHVSEFTAYTPSSVTTFVREDLVNHAPPGNATASRPGPPEDDSTYQTIKQTTSPGTSCGLRLGAFERLQSELRQQESLTRLLIAKPEGGLGNRFSSTIGMLAVALITDRAVQIAWHDFEGMDAALEPNFIDWRPWNRSNIQNTPVPQPTFDLTSLGETEFNHLAAVDIVNIKVFKGPNFWLPYKVWSPFVLAKAAEKGLDLRSLSERCAFDYLFKATPGVAQRVQDFTAVLRPDGAPYLAMHVRTGPGEAGQDPRWDWFVDPEDTLSKLPALVRDVSSEYGMSDTTKWLIATDDVDFGLAMRSRYPQNVILTNDNVQFLEGLHMAKGHPTQDSFVNTYADWFLLIQSDLFVRVGGSSFSNSVVRMRGSRCTRVGTVLGRVDQQPKDVEVCP